MPIIVRPAEAPEWTAQQKKDWLEVYKALGRKKPRKYRNEPVMLDGYRFASKAEGARYLSLRLQESAGVITDLNMHPKFPLAVGGELICHYEADFAYTVLETGDQVIEDVKQPRTMTAVYRLKKKLMKAIHGVTVQEYMPGFRIVPHGKKTARHR